MNARAAWRPPPAENETAAEVVGTQAAADFQHSDERNRNPIIHGEQATPSESPPRCTACLSLVSPPSHTLCRSCRAWALLDAHIRRANLLAQLIEEGRDA